MVALTCLVNYLFFSHFHAPATSLFPRSCVRTRKNMVSETDILNISGILEKFLLKGSSLPDHGHGVKCHPEERVSELNFYTTYSTRR